jgi:hypothetical protein
MVSRLVDELGDVRVFALGVGRGVDRAELLKVGGWVGGRGAEAPLRGGAGAGSVHGRGQCRPTASMDAQRLDKLVCACAKCRGSC